MIKNCMLSGVSKVHHRPSKVYYLAYKVYPYLKKKAMLFNENNRLSKSLDLARFVIDSTVLFFDIMQL